ncbi:MAG: hypothetical protein QXJ74_02910 [Nitrososphaera sp.]|uniref:hypothetical protein n=1 Tax=Nitrososphaera sp. TaxID=1971748 RepID=UPI0018508BCC|nr:hypothetical protein [Nitrososphaera sp.]NWG37928.1 hypothetical protein [Nitrososphaera sp.]
MTPKRQVAIMVGVFSALGVGVSVGIIAFGGGFSGGGNLFNPPTAADIYVVGAQVTDGMELGYTLTGMGPATSLEDADVSIAFDRQGDSWLTTFNIVNGTGARSDFDLLLSSQLTKEGQPDEEAKPFLEPVESSILAIRDMDYGGRDKYLVVGAPWNTIFYSSSSIVVRVTAQETVQTQAGTFDAFLLSYKLGEKTSSIWVVKDLPLPVKAEVYDPSDQLLYQYELVSLSR